MGNYFITFCKVSTKFLKSMLFRETSFDAKILTEIDLTSLQRSQLDPATALLTTAIVWTLKKTVYLTSLKELLLAAGTGALVVRPGIPFRALAEVEKLVARVAGYRDPNLVPAHVMGPRMANIFLYWISKYCFNRIGLSVGVGISLFVISNFFSKWVENLIIYIKSEGGKDTQSETLMKDDIPRRRPIYLNPPQNIIEENDSLKREIKRLKARNRLNRYD